MKDLKKMFKDLRKWHCEMYETVEVTVCAQSSGCQVQKIRF